MHGVQHMQSIEFGVIEFYSTYRITVMALPSNGYGVIESYLYAAYAIRSNTCGEPHPIR
jgi:hypothetical protein